MIEIRLAKSSSGFALLDDWHEKFHRRLSYPTQTRRVETSFGHTDVVVTGPAAEGRGSADLPPVLLLHGAMAGAPHALGELGDYPRQRSIYAVNIPGQSTRAAQKRLSFRSSEYSAWITEVMDALELPTAHVAGVSWGGAVALRLAIHNPGRISGLLLVVPGSIIRSPVLAGLLGVGLPILRYKVRPTQANLERGVRNLLTESDELWLPYIGDALRHWRVDFSAPPLVKESQVANLQAPTFVIAAEKDLSFPGGDLIRRAQELFPNFSGSHLLKDSRHCPSSTPEARARFAGIVDQALLSFDQNRKGTL
ncbi:MAG: alpha/beta hydrolase [Planctomycetota bacterium]|nr:alpha/beta hydrolase [Planctomycetota bacterium]